MSDHKITIWGTGKTGKTTYLAMLYHEFLSRSPEWFIEGENEAADRFIKEKHREIFVEKSFPKSTEGYHEYTYIITRRKAGQVAYVIELEFNDIAGEIYEKFYEDSLKNISENAAGISPQAWFERMCDSDGILMLLDPSWHKRSKQKTYNALVRDFVEQLRKRRKASHKEGDLSSYDPRLKEVYIAFGLTKADANPEFWQLAANWECSRGTGAACHANCPIRELMPDFMDNHLQGMILPENVRCFLLSSIGRLNNAEGSEQNISPERVWARRSTPLPPRVQPLMATSALEQQYLSLSNDLKGLQNRIENSGVLADAKSRSNFFPSAIRDVAGIKPTNLIQPIEWLVEEIRASKGAIDNVGED